MSRRLRACVIGGGGGLVIAGLIRLLPTDVLAAVAFVLALVQLLGLVAVVVLVSRLWADNRATVMPLLSMFAPSAVGAEPAGGADSGRIAAPSAAERALRDGIAERMPDR